jgi:hypothetical protein
MTLQDERVKNINNTFFYNRKHGKRFVNELLHLSICHSCKEM